MFDRLLHPKVSTLCNNHDLLFFYSFMVQAMSLHASAARLWLLSTLSSPRPACGLLKCQTQFSAVLFHYVDPSFLLSCPLSGSVYIAVVCNFGASSVLHPIFLS